MTTDQPTLSAEEVKEWRKTLERQFVVLEGTNESRRFSEIGTLCDMALRSLPVAAGELRYNRAILELEDARKCADLWKQDHDAISAKLAAANAELEGKVAVSRGQLQDALNYIKHCGANAIMRGQPHPQQMIVDWIEAALLAASGGGGR